MSKKQKYSLTSEQRKELRHRENAKNSVKDSSEEAVNKNKFNWWIIPLIACALALIVTAIILPFTCSTYGSVKNPETGELRPVAKIELSNGMFLEFEIFEDTCPIAATNFIYLARSKFFEDNIIFDTQQGWVRFGDMTSMTEYKSDDTEYLEKLKGIDSHKKKLGYRLYEDSSSDAKMYEQEGMLVFDYKNSSCQFFMSSGSNLQTRLGSVDHTPTVVGRYLNDTLEKIQAISELPVETDSAHSVWIKPQQTIRIKSVKLYNLNNKKWRKFNFESYMGTARENENTAIYRWVDS